MNKRGSYYSQLVRGTALQVISNAVAKFGFNIEFIPVKDVSDSSQYAKGVDKTLMRQKELINSFILSEGTESEKILRDKFKMEMDKTIVCLYNTTGLTLAETNYMNDRSKPHKYLREVKALVGYRYAKVDGTNTNTNILSTETMIPDYSEVFENGVEFADEVIKVEAGADLSKLKDIKKEKAGLILVRILKDIVRAKFSVDISFIVASENLLHNLQFILLKNLYTSSDQTEQTISLKYNIDGIDSNEIKQEYSYTLSELSGFGTVGSDNKSKLYTLGLTINDIQGTLLSDYNLYEPVKELVTYPISYTLKIGTTPSRNDTFKWYLY